MVFSFYNVALTIPFLMLLLGTFEIKNAYSSPNVRTRGDMYMRVKKSQKNAKYYNICDDDNFMTSNKLKPRTPSQVLYAKSLVDADISLLLVNGPAGSGKTHFACDAAVSKLLEGEVEKIIVTRPTIPVDNEEIGFIPGTIQRKMAPWLRPVNDVLLNHFSQREIDRMVMDGVIEISPIAHMRGRTFTNSYVIADEMQNSTPLQMKMLLTRLGEDSKMIITGDLNQSDLKTENNGFLDFIDRYEKHVEQGTDIRDVHLVWLTQKDVFRSDVVKSIIRIYDGFDDSINRDFNRIDMLQKNDQEYDDSEELDNQYLQIVSVLDKLDNNDENVKPATNDRSSKETMDCAMIPEKQISKHFDKNDKLKKRVKKRG